MKTKTKIKVLYKCYLKAVSNGSDQFALNDMKHEISKHLSVLGEEDPDEYTAIIEENPGLTEVEE